MNKFAGFDEEDNNQKPFEDKLFWLFQHEGSAPFKKANPDKLSRRNKNRVKGVGVICPIFFNPRYWNQ